MMNCEVLNICLQHVVYDRCFLIYLAVNWHACLVIFGLHMCPDCNTYSSCGATPPTGGGALPQLRFAVFFVVVISFSCSTLSFKCAVETDQASHAGVVAVDLLAGQIGRAHV